MPSVTAPLKLSDPSNLTAFGEFSVSSVTPVAQVDFCYGINPNVLSSATASGGSVTSASAMGVISSGTASGGSATLFSRRYIKYRPGEGGLARFTAIFTPGVQNSKQYAGISNADVTNGYCFGYQGAAFGILYINDGVETFIPQSSFNTNKFGIDPTKGNIYQIKWQYLGFGAIFFYIEDPSTGQFTLVHMIKYANSALVPSVSNPSFNLVWKSINTGNTTNMVVKCGSGMLGVEGLIRNLGSQYGYNNSKTGISTTRTNIFTLRNCTTFNTKTNRAQLKLRNISVAGNVNSGNALITFQLHINSTLGGVPAYTALDSGTTPDNGVTVTGNSFTSVDTAGTTVTGGSVIYSSIINANTNVNIEFALNEIFLNPGETMTFSVASTSSATIGVSCNFFEDI